MILVDTSQICIAAISMQVHVPIPDKYEDEAFLLHVILNSLRANIKRFKREYGPEVVLAFDSPNTWRNEIFPFYKQHRKLQRAASPIDWKKAYAVIDTFRAESNKLPYKSIHLPRCEADDIIAVLSKQTTEPTVIISSDKDFLQLLDNPLIKQWSPRHQSFLACPNPALRLKELIIGGDLSDGIPNVLSADNAIIIGKKQTPLTAKRRERLLENTFADYDEKTQRNYKRNEELISFARIPDEIRDTILTTYKNAIPGTKYTMLRYFMDRKLRSLIDKADEF